MAGALLPILSYAKCMGWRGRILTLLGLALAVDVVYEVYRYVGKRKRQKPFCEVRFMNRAIVSDCSPNLMDAKFANMLYLISYIDRAQHTICLSMYYFTLNNVCDAIIRAKYERNVTVRVVCCASMVSNEGSQIRRLNKACFVRFKAGYLMHHKFCLLDVDWLCSSCLVEEHIQQVGLPTPRQVQHPFDKAIRDDMERLVDTFGCACRRCNPPKPRSVSSSVSNPLPEGGCLITGSGNWTLPAMTDYRDSMIFTSHPAMVRPFAVEFQRQWFELSQPEKSSK